MLSRIEREFEASDQRRFFVPCPHCNHLQWLRFEQLRWERSETGSRPETAAYVCESCETPIAEHHKTEMLARGDWRATAVSTNPHAIGFHLSALYSPIGWKSWEQIARDWLAAQGSDEMLRAARGEVAAPGVGITSSWYSSPSATNTISGTSMAAPHVAGAAALLLAAEHTGAVGYVVFEWLEGFYLLDLLRAAALPVGEDDNLVFAEVGNRVDGHAADREEAPAEEEERRPEDEEAIVERPLDEGVDHGRGPKDRLRGPLRRSRPSRSRRRDSSAAACVGPSGLCRGREPWDTRKL